MIRVCLDTGATERMCDRSRNEMSRPDALVGSRDRACFPFWAQSVRARRYNNTEEHKCNYW